MFGTTINVFLILILILLALTIPSETIFVPLSGRAPRCMIVYSVGETETVKLDINFPPLELQQEHEYYELSWKNTESNEVSTDTKPNGRFRRELALVQSTAPATQTTSMTCA
jgi:hypothetical protein